ncbi:hypothetical protein WOLCODRAFT_138823 [Wolfiporia cocos MD-104 SS10]|uniref:C2H2-type domain-containing protein n=1 Tax=Wolfiporia cocos (strain MD-104) TaxID=742152 RepID=A0A2H3JPV6_WOLCO|nr:hypothetical protein WOLCODRAFT_138823 [Wolfiporia cocos MD-104 SS10]
MPAQRGFAVDCSCVRNGAGASANCEECAHECPSSPCNVELSEECTDQCVVVACNDAHHGAITCESDPSDVSCEPCDMACTSGPTCNELEDFFQCCNEYHGSFSEPRAFPADMSTVPDFSWDSSSLTALLCGCSEPATQFGHTHASGSAIDAVGATSPTSPPARMPAFQAGPEPAGVQPSPMLVAGSGPPAHGHAPLQQYYPSPQSTHSPQAQTPTAAPAQVHKCQWGGCFDSFATLGELVGHVNLQHLRMPAGGAEPSPLMPVSAAPGGVAAAPGSAGANALSCLWADCHIYPTPQSIPGPSTGNTADSALGLLASHLFEDHLGLPLRPAPMLTRPPPPLSHPQPHVYTAPSPGAGSQSGTASAPSTHGPPTPLPEHDCSEPNAHVCRWRGCAESFASCDALTAHIAVAHVGAGRAHYNCFWEGCGRNGDHGFASKQKILRHLQSHTGHRPFHCKICQQNFSEAATLAQHMRRHTQEKPYVCDFPGCGKAFAITGALTIHKRTHNGHKPFKCTYCDRAFAESSNLSKHLRTHTGARPYHCVEPGCNKSFARPDQLARHQNVHKKKNMEAAGVNAIAVAAVEAR